MPVRTNGMASRDRSTAYSGILNVDKPIGKTSHDVVNVVRRAIGMRRVGHAGTLDPLAHGVLLVCVGAATRVSEYLMESTKVYRGVVSFGAASTTDDAEGALTPVGIPEPIGIRELESAAVTLIGDVDQIPPAYSAIKVAGKPLYERARTVETFTPAARRVRIDRIEILSWSPPDATIEVICSKGTYIRSIARDLGVALGTAAYLAGLSRLASGSFRVADSIPLGEISRAASLGYVDRLLYPIDAAVGSWPAVVLSAGDVRRVMTGGSLAIRWAIQGGRLRAYDRAGEMVALLYYREDREGWYPSKVFGLGATHGLA
jgi:tRNA pseudouridine55 synthase